MSLKRVALFTRLTTDAGTEVEDYWRSLAVSSLLGLWEHCGRDGDKVEVILKDTGSLPGITVDEFLKIELDDDGGVDAIVGPVLSAVAVPLSTLAGVRGVPSVSFSATSRDLSNAPLFARVLPSDAEVTVALCELLSELGVKNVALIFTDDDYGTAYRDSLVSACTDNGGPSVHATSFQQDSESSIEFAMNFVKSRNLNIIVTVSFTESLSVIFNNAEEDQFFIVSDAVTVDSLESFTALDPAANRGFVEERVMRIQATGYNKYQPYRDFAARWPTLAQNATLLSFFNEQLGAANDNVNISTVDEAFFNNTVNDVSAYIPFAYDASRTVCEALLSQSTGSESTVKTERGEALWERIVSNTFLGVSGNVSIDKETQTRDVASSNFVLERFVRAGELSYDAYAAGRYADQIWELSESSLPELPPDVTVHLEANYIQVGAKITSIVLAVVLIQWSLGLAAFTWVKRKTRIMSRAQPTILISFLVGVAISSCTLFFVGLEDVSGLSQEFQDFSCMAVFWFWSIGTVLTFGALTAKLYRIYRIFHNKALRRIRITNMHLYAALGAIVAVDVAILTVWSVVSPLRWERTVDQIDDYDNPTVTYGQCTSDQETVFMALLLTYTFALFIAGAVFSFMVRNTPSEFQESTHIVISLVSQVQLYCLGFLILFIFPKFNSEARFIVMSVVIFFNNLLLTLVIYVPKFVAMYNNTNRANSLNTFTQQQQQRVGPSSRLPPRQSVTDLARSEAQSGASPPLLELRHYPSSLEGFNRRDASVQVSVRDGHLESDVRTLLVPDSILHEVDEDLSHLRDSASEAADADDEEEHEATYVQTLVEASTATATSDSEDDDEDDDEKGEKGDPSAGPRRDNDGGDGAGGGGVNGNGNGQCEGPGGQLALTIA